MEEYTANTFSEISKIFDKYKKSNLWVFRGQANANWELTPKAFRSTFKIIMTSIY
jgi:hypothetical protein